MFLARAGWLRGYVLSLEGTPGAFWIGTLRNGVFVSDYLAFDPAFADYAPGIYLMVKAIETLAVAKKPLWSAGRSRIRCWSGMMR